MATFLALLVVMAAVGLLLRALIVDAFAQSAAAGPDPRISSPLPRSTDRSHPGSRTRSTAAGHRVHPDALVWNAIDDLQVRRLLSGSADNH